MASEISNQATNGSYAGQHSFDMAEMPAVSQPNATVAVNGGPVTEATSTNNPQSSPSKDEVGWYFVEQYYTTLSRSPEKIHLFYAKRSQFVSGVEAEKVSVSVGQRAIAERIKELDIQDCKVRVTNVDSQESGRDIVVQVIGEMSNKSLPHRKFVQTFILAEQPNGYYVLNDIFRYIADEEEEEVEEPIPQTEAAAPAAQETEQVVPETSVEKPAQDQDIQALDKKLEETAAEPEIQPAAVTAPLNTEPPAEESEAVAKDVEAPTKTEAPEAQAGAIQRAEAEVAADMFEEEVPKDPEPTKAPSPKPLEQPRVATPPVDEPAAPPKPSAPKTWASMVAGPKAPVPAIPQILPANNVSQSKPASQPAPAPVSTAASVTEEALPSPGGWQTAGQDHGRRQGRQQSGSISTAAGDRGNVSAYIKGVIDKVDAAVLKATLSKYGKLDYFDVSRAKNCAFVEFGDPAGYQAAVAANPHVVSGCEITVEERRRNPQYGGFNARGGMRGRGGLDGRTPSQGGRGNFNKDGRGNFGPRGRGGNMVSRGRGTAQAA